MFTEPRSRSQVKVASAGPLSLVYITDRHGCRDPETVLAAIECAVHTLWTLRESHEIAVNVRPHEGNVCFSVRPAGRHSVHVTRSGESLCFPGFPSDTSGGRRFPVPPTALTVRVLRVFSAPAVDLRLVLLFVAGIALLRSAARLSR